MNASTQSWTWVTFSWPDPTHQLMDPSWPDPPQNKNVRPDPTRPITTVRPIYLYAYLLITFASVTDCLKNKHFIHECLIYTENNFSRTSNSLNCANFTITLSVTFCIIQGDPHRPTQMNPTQPNPLSKEKIWTRLDPTRPDPTRGWTRPMSNSASTFVFSDKCKFSVFRMLRINHQREDKLKIKCYNRFLSMYVTLLLFICL